MAKAGWMTSSSMHTPTTTMRLPKGASRTALSIMPGTPTASNSTSVLRPSTRRQASMPGSSRGSTDSWAPSVRAKARRLGEKSVATMGSIPFRRRAAITASPTGPQPSTSAASPWLIPALPTAWMPTAMGSVRAACWGDRPLGTSSSKGADSSMRSA